MIKRVAAIKRYMGTTKPVTFDELKELVTKDKTAFNWMAKECAKQLGEELDTEV